MKKILLSILLFAATGSAVKTFGQLVNLCKGGASSCNLIPQDVRIQTIAVNCNFGGNPLKTEVFFNVNFKLVANDGNKNIFFHTWLSNDYPASYGVTDFPCGGTGTEKAPTSATLGTAIDDLQKSFMDIGVNNVASLGVGVTQTLTLKTLYHKDNTVILTSPSNSNEAPGYPGLPGGNTMSVTKTLLANGFDSISIRGARVVINVACNTPIITKTLVWASNSQNEDIAQCWAAQIRQSFNDPSLTGHKNCTSPDRSYVFGASTADTTTTQLKYTVWIDVNGDGVVSPGDVKAVDTVYVNGFNASHPYSIGPVAYLPYSHQGAYAEKALIVQATTGLISNFIEIYFANPAQCAPLPVKLKSFNAARNHTVVGLDWVTSSEQNNSGFAIERLVGAGGWQQIAFVATKAAGGNSSSDIAYQYTDLNNTTAVSQYRLKQIDFDNRSSMSDIRAVRGEGQVGKTIVYPNPSNNGRVTVVFEDVTATRDVSLMDMSGRMIKQIKAVTNNNIQFENLTPGVYSLRVINRETGDQVVEKIVVNNR